MKINYKFVAGEKIKIKVYEDFSLEIAQVKNTVYNNNHKKTRRHKSYRDNNDNDHAGDNEGRDDCPYPEKGRAKEAIAKRAGFTSYYQIWWHRN